MESGKLRLLLPFEVSISFVMQVFIYVGILLVQADGVGLMSFLSLGVIVAL